MNAETYLALVRRPDGSLRPYSEVAEAELRTKTAAHNAQVLADRETEAAKPELVRRIELHQVEYDHARRNDDHGRAKMYKTKLDMLREQLASEQAAEAKARQFAGDRRIALIRQEAELIAASGHTLLPHASQIERDNLVAIATSNDWPDPQSQFAAFKELSDRLTDVELEAERVKQSDATLESLRQNVTLADSRVQQSELELLRARRENVADES